MKILQENGEVVLCVGSSLNMANTPVFLQADCRYFCFPEVSEWLFMDRIIKDKYRHGLLSLSDSCTCVNAYTGYLGNSTVQTAGAVFMRGL